MHWKGWWVGWKSTVISRKVLLRFIVRVREEVHLIMINIKVDITRSAAKKKKILKDIAQSIKRRVDLYSRKRRRLLDWQHILECYRTRQDWIPSITVVVWQIYAHYHFKETRLPPPSESPLFLVGLLKLQRIPLNVMSSSQAEILLLIFFCISFKQFLRRMQILFNLPFQKFSSINR